MEARIASWNIESRGSDYETGERGTASHIMQGIQQLNADILVLPDAFAGEAAPAFDAGMREQGYKWHDVLYGDKGRDWSLSHTGVESGMRVATRWEVVDVEEVRWGVSRRRMIVMVVRDPATGKLWRIIGAHFDDRTEENRVSQVQDGANYLHHVEEMSTALVGDLNTAHGDDWRARMFGNRAMRYIARHIPSHVTATPGEFPDNLYGFAVRGTDMLSGKALELLKQSTNLRDLDSKRQATATLKLNSFSWLPSIRILQLDHIYATSDIQTDGVKVWPDGGSDHRAISALLRVLDTRQTNKLVL